MHIEPKPTEYDGVQYRSRLEARWAIFFTLAGFSFQYEPKGKGTTPDFRIRAPDMVVSLEVKPSMVKKLEYWYLRKQSVNFLGIGGFFDGHYPTLVQIREKSLQRRDFDIVFKHKHISRIYHQAERYRFDLA